MQCVECDNATRKYKCPRCNINCCSFECFKKHKAKECISVAPAPAKQPSTKGTTPKRSFQYNTEDTVNPEQLAKLADCEALKELLRNEHLRKYLTDIDTSTNAWNAMKHAMTEPLFIEFADECLKIVESPEATQ